MDKIVIFGNTKLAELAHFYLTKDSPNDVVAFTVDEEYIKEKEFCGLPVIPYQDIVNLYPPDDFKMIVSIGYKDMNKIREKKYHQSKEKGYTLISYINSRAILWIDSKNIGDNCFILENQIVQPDVIIHNNIVIWGGCHFGHNTIIRDNTWISPHAAICGGVEICENSFIGANVTIKDNVRIGRECIIGAGSLILNDADDKSVYVEKNTDIYRLDSEYFNKLMDISR